MTVRSFAQTLDQELAALARGASLECLVCGEFVMHRGGEIVVALAGDDEAADEATVKRFYREPDRVRLQPENDALEPIYARHVQILGRVVGVFRRL